VAGKTGSIRVKLYPVTPYRPYTLQGPSVSCEVTVSLKTHIRLCDNLINYQSKHNSYFIPQALATCFGLINPSLSHVQKTKNRYKTTPCQHAVLSLWFCGIYHNNYHYNEIIIVRGPLPRLKIIKNVIGNV